MTWPIVDKNHRHCSRCSHVFRNIELDDGLCEKCIASEAEERNAILSQAENKVISKGTSAAAKLLSTLNSQGKSGASMPLVLGAFFENFGGEDEFGKSMSSELRKAMGEDLSPTEEANFEYAPKIVQNWFDIISRYASKVDEGKSLDVSSLEEGDLEAILADLGRKQLQEDPALRRAVLIMAIRDDPKFRREAFAEAVREDRSLVDKLLEDNGIDTVAGQAREIPDDEPTLNIEAEDYNPSDEEYQG